jgi:HSP20 family molecular chaperone IbpA
MNVYRGDSWMWAEACALLDQAERRHRQFFGLPTGSSRSPVWEPPVDIFSRGPELQVVVALPGVRAEDVSVQITTTGLQIETSVSPPALPGGAELVRLEIPYGRMRRRVELPPGRYALVESRLERGCLFLQLARSMP